MNRFSFRKTAFLALVILLVGLCVLFVCACSKTDEPEPDSTPTLSVDFSTEGTPYPGELLTIRVFVDSEEYDGEYLLAVDAEEGAASAEGKSIRIAQEAKAGSVIRIFVMTQGVSVTHEITVLGTDVEKITLVCPESAEAGEEILLDAVVEPAGAAKSEITYLLLSGKALLEGNCLNIDPDADRADKIRLQAKAEGVLSEEKVLSITTVQTTSLRLSAVADRLLPGEETSVALHVEPADTSYPPIVTVTAEEGYAHWDADAGILRVAEDTPLGSRITLTVTSGRLSDTHTIYVGYPAIKQIVTPIGPVKAFPGEEQTISFSLFPEDAYAGDVTVTVLDGEPCLQWQEGIRFAVRNDAVIGTEIVFGLSSADGVEAIVSYVVASSYSLFLSPKQGESTAYLKSNESVEFETICYGAYEGEITYRVTSGADLVRLDGSRVTVLNGADAGFVTIVAVSEDGVESNEVVFPVAGRYTRVTAASWSRLSFPEGEESIWLVLPAERDAGILTVVVPKETTELVIEGQYDGREESAYKDLYFYFRNAAERRVTFMNFGTIASAGLGGTVMDFGSAGHTEIVLVGENLVQADSPYSLNNSGEVVNGVWETGQTQEVLVKLKRSGKDGYVGTAGGTAIAGYRLSFMGEGSLTAIAGNGVNGTAGGKGADVKYSGASVYQSGDGGAGGPGGDSGVAIQAESVSFSSGFVMALPGNAGVGGAGGAAGSLSEVADKNVTATAGAAGATGANGICYPAVYAGSVSGESYTSSYGEVQSFTRLFTGGLPAFVEKLSKFYNITIKYGTALENPYANKKKSEKYVMQQQTNETDLLLQTNFLMYSLSRLSKNSWQEIYGLMGAKVTIYLCKSIENGSGANILGLTSSGDKSKASGNKIWFATFATEIRGVYYSGYLNIMLHEFVHVFHFDLEEKKRSEMENLVKTYYNGGISYSSNPSNAYVYGVTTRYDETNSYYLTTYSKKSVMEDVSETLSMPAIFLQVEPSLEEERRIRRKYDYLVSFFGGVYETLSPVKLKNFFGYAHLFE